MGRDLSGLKIDRGSHQTARLVRSRAQSTLTAFSERRLRGDPRWGDRFVGLAGGPVDSLNPSMVLQVVTDCESQCITLSNEVEEESGQSVA